MAGPAGEHKGLGSRDRNACLPLKGTERNATPLAYKSLISTTLKSPDVLNEIFNIKNKDIFLQIPSLLR